MAVLGIFLALFLLMYLAYRGWSVILIAPILALLAVAMSGESTFLASYTQIFMKAMGNFATTYFPIFLLGAIFGKLMETSGSAYSIAKNLIKWTGLKHAVLAVVLACGILTYGGVSAFVVSFAVYPLGVALFREANLPKRFLAGSLALGALTFSMTCFPGTVQIHNLIPMPYFKTDSFAAPIFGITAGTAMMLAGVLWINFRVNRAKSRGEGFGDHHKKEELNELKSYPSFFISMLPVISVISLNYIFSEFVFKNMNADYLSEEKFGSTTISQVRGLWAMILALASSSLILIILNLKRLTKIPEILTNGTMSSLLPTFNTGAEVGFGAIIASLSSFILVKDWVMGLAPGNPLISESVAINILAGITGSAAGGLGIALEAFGDEYMRLALETGINPEYLHRIASMSSGGLDSLPHNGAVITLLTICGLTHKESYGDIAMVSLVFPVLTTITSIFVLSFIL